MLRIRLETSNGSLVSSVELPLFKMLPDVVVWGTRCFQKHGLNADGPIYRECFCWVIPEEEQGNGPVAAG